MKVNTHRYTWNSVIMLKKFLWVIWLSIVIQACAVLQAEGAGVYVSAFVIKNNTSLASSFFDNHYDLTYQDYYWWNQTAADTGTNFLPAGSSFSAVTQALVAGFSTSYVPITGTYTMRLHSCASTTAGQCTVSSSSSFVESGAMTLTSAKPITAQDAVFTFSGTVPNNGPVCYTFVDSSGHEWSTPAARTCQDAGALPTVPSTCYLNANADLTVNMGTLERSEISTEPSAGASGNVKESVGVLCTRDAGTTVSTTFQFTPLTVNGKKLVHTSSANLGIAIYYGGKLISSSSDPITETFALGYTDREFEFQAVRDPNVALTDIPTGDFNASAIMIMAEQ